MQAINKLKKYKYKIYTLNLLLLNLLFLLIIFIILLNHNIAECTAVPNYTRTSLASLKEMVSIMTPQEIEIFNMSLDKLDQELERSNIIGWESVCLFVAITVSLYLITRYGDTLLLDLVKMVGGNAFEFPLEDAKQATNRKIHTLINTHGVDTIPDMTRIAKEIIENRTHA